jgi:ParG
VKSTPTTEDMKRMNMNVPKSLHDAFKAATAARGENMTNVLLEYVEQYVAKHGAAPKKKGGRR